MEEKFFHSNSDVKKFSLTKFNFTFYFQSNQTTKIYYNLCFTSIKFLPPHFPPIQTKHQCRSPSRKFLVFIVPLIDFKHFNLILQKHFDLNKFLLSLDNFGVNFWVRDCALRSKEYYLSPK